MMKRLTESNIADKDLLASTNKLLVHVGITAKQIISIDELTRVSVCDADSVLLVNRRNIVSFPSSAM
jgi:hypothetical protein